MVEMKLLSHVMKALIHVHVDGHNNHIHTWPRTCIYVCAHVQCTCCDAPTAQWFRCGDDVDINL